MVLLLGQSKYLLFLLFFLLNVSASEDPLANYQQDFRFGYEENLKKGYDGLITVIKSSDFIVSGSNQPLNYSWGPWHKYSQFLDSYYYITGALFISSIDQMIKNRYVISKNPFLFEVSPFEAIDIDTEYDFELAKILMKNSDILKNKC